MDKFVIVKHKPADTKCYLFSVPEGLELFAGDVVMCDNRQKAEAVCVSDSFFTTQGDEVLRLMKTDRARLRNISSVKSGVQRPAFIEGYDANGVSVESAGITLAEML